MDRNTEINIILGIGTIGNHLMIEQTQGTFTTENRDVFDTPILSCFRGNRDKIVSLLTQLVDQMYNQLEGDADFEKDYDAHVHLPNPQ